MGQLSEGEQVSPFSETLKSYRSSEVILADFSCRGASETNIQGSDDTRSPDVIAVDGGRRSRKHYGRFIRYVSEPTTSEVLICLTVAQCF